MKTQILMLVVLIMVSSCSKNEATELQDQLPPITTTGANTAGCIINGKIIIPKNGLGGVGVDLLMDYVIF